MPKMVSELMQGKSFSRSAEGGTLSDTATRTWKVILSHPGESYYLNDVIGVQIGDLLPGADNPIPCVSIDVKGDGESRLVRVITATYKAMPGSAGAGEDPGQYSPDVRPANFSTSTSLYEMPAYSWVRRPGNTWSAIHNSAGDLIDGITKVEPITTIRVTQFSVNPGTAFAQYCGCINDEAMSLGPYATYERFTVMFRGVEVQPHVESFGSTIYRGFMNTYEFAYRSNFVDGEGNCGWDVVVPLTGWNVKSYTPNLVDQTRDPFAQPLKKDSRKIVVPLALPDGVQTNQKVRAQVMTAESEEGGATQIESALPVALNEDGTPRKIDGDNPPILWRGGVQRAVNLTGILQLRLGL